MMKTGLKFTVISYCSQYYFHYWSPLECCCKKSWKFRVCSIKDDSDDGMMFSLSCGIRSACLKKVTVAPWGRFCSVWLTDWGWKWVNIQDIIPVHGKMPWHEPMFIIVLYLRQYKCYCYRSSLPSLVINVHGSSSGQLCNIPLRSKNMGNRTSWS